MTQWASGGKGFHWVRSITEVSEHEIVLERGRAMATHSIGEDKKHMGEGTHGQTGKSLRS